MPAAGRPLGLPSVILTWLNIHCTLCGILGKALWTLELGYNSQSLHQHKEMCSFGRFRLGGTASHLDLPRELPVSSAADTACLAPRASQGKRQVALRRYPRIGDPLCRQVNNKKPATILVDPTALQYGPMSDVSHNMVAIIDLLRYP